MSKVCVQMDKMTGDGGSYIPLSEKAIYLIFDYWADTVIYNGLFNCYCDKESINDLDAAAKGEIDICLTKALHWDQFGYHFTGSLGNSKKTLHFYVEIYIGGSSRERLHVGSDFKVKETTTRWKIVTIADTYNYGGYNDKFRNKPPFPQKNSPNLAKHMPPKKPESDTVGKWKHDKYTPF